MTYLQRQESLLDGSTRLDDPEMLRLSWNLKLPYFYFSVAQKHVRA